MSFLKSGMLKLTVHCGKWGNEDKGDVTRNGVLLESPLRISLIFFFFFFLMGVFHGKPGDT